MPTLNIGEEKEFKKEKTKTKITKTKPNKNYKKWHYLSTPSSEIPQPTPSPAAGEKLAQEL